MSRASVSPSARFRTQHGGLPARSRHPSASSARQAVRGVDRTTPRPSSRLEAGESAKPGHGGYGPNSSRSGVPSPGTRLSRARSTTAAPPHPRLRRRQAYPDPVSRTDTGPDRTRMVIAVGTALTGGPPRRSQRALLTHWAPASGTNAKATSASIVQHSRGPVTDCATARFRVWCLLGWRRRSRGAARGTRVRTGSDRAGLCLPPCRWG